MLPKKLKYAIQGAALVSFFGIAFFACTKDEPVQNVPFIKYLGISTETIIQQQDKLIVTIYYEDGDGDLGSDNPDVNLVRVKDSRLPFADYYYLPPLAPLDHELPIQGELDIEIFPIILIGNGSQETAVFTISLEDRAGNQSNEITTPQVTILRE